MVHERLLDKDQVPDKEYIRRTIGREVWPVWEDVVDFLDGAYPDFHWETIYYNPQHGWAQRFRRDTQQLLLLFPESGAFTALVTLSPEEEEEAREKIHYFNRRFQEALNSLSSLPQGRWLWIQIEDHTDFFGLRLLLSLKRL